MGLVTVALTESLVENLITPIVGARSSASRTSPSCSFTINDSVFRYGAFINSLIVFVGTAVAIYFFVIVPYKKYQELKGASPKTRPCPECTTQISVAARRCPACTAVVIPDAA